jgi:hypothetical protein
VRHLLIGRDQQQTFDAGLGEQQTVERIPMQGWQSSDR